MVSRMTAALLTEKALQGTVSGLHWINLKGKLRLYACWMTAASWKDPELQHRKQYELPVTVLWFNENQNN